MEVLRSSGVAIHPASTPRMNWATSHNSTNAAFSEIRCESPRWGANRWHCPVGSTTGMPAVMPPPTIEGRDYSAFVLENCKNRVPCTAPPLTQ